MRSVIPKGGAAGGGEKLFLGGKMLGFVKGKLVLEREKWLLGGEMMLWKGEEPRFWRRKVVFFRQKLDLRGRLQRFAGGKWLFEREESDLGRIKVLVGSKKLLFGGKIAF